ncbi:hypothetical protein TTHERM_00013780 (macronuclear) [Tetrahymena thermophila SB210]|uniref:Uncharacterized protein n=1 Tax=Tetrahymena thermophila (strain SB210) TaxID=312017 RepID=Q22RL0_TETTS|nr:hypothetical protein TTHERM_00013780 [Tetrahymena thermophila SB210]EAR88112.2 hypothetical protein TTHERM_00013780 [Tetrahymena thermophila SB210]|eukprot:XP_001008357.2 hypothetical protein TTHERM_00013780 [Tetrahymena thermophila SB210]
MNIFNLKQFFLSAIQDIDNLRLPYPFEQLNIKTKIIATICLTIITTSLTLKLLKKLIFIIQASFQKVIQIRKNRQIKDISEMFDEKVNIQAESVDNLVHLMDKFQGKSLNQKYEQMNAFKQNPQTYSDANFAYKPRNFQLLERIRRENEEREKQNDPNIANRYNRNGFNKMNDFANYSMANADQFNSNYNFNDDMHSQSMQLAPQQKFITAEDGLPSTVHNRNGIDLFSSPQFGQSIFKEDIQKPINRQNSVFFSFADEPQAFQNNIMQKQAEIYNKISNDLKQADQKEMELEDHAPLAATTQEKQSQIIQNNVESQQKIANKNETIEEENNNQNNKEHKKKNEALKKVIKNKLISKNTNNKFIKPTKSSVAEKNEYRAQKDFKNASKKNQKLQLRQQQEEEDDEDYYEEEEDYDEEFIIYKKAKKLQAVPFKKQKKITKRSSVDEDFLVNQSIQKQRKSNSNHRDMISQSLNLSQQHKQQRNLSNQLSEQNNQQLQSNLLSQQAQQRQSSSQSIQQQQQQQQQQQIGLQTQQQQQIPQLSQENQFLNQTQNQVQQEQILKQQSQQLKQQPVLLPKVSQPQAVNQVEQQNMDNILQQGSNNNDSSSLCLPPPKNMSQKWNYSQNFSQKNLPFFNVEQFQHQNIEISQKVGFNIFDEKNNKGYKAYVFNNQNSYIMPIDNSETENQEEKKEDKSVEGANNEQESVNQ